MLDNITILYGVILACVCYLFLRKSALDKIPGPKQLPFIGNAFQLDPKFPHMTFYKWAKKYGSLYKIKLLGSEFVMVSDIKGLQEVLLKNGKVFAGRQFSYRLKVSKNYHL